MRTHKDGRGILYLAVRAAAYLSAAYLCALALLIMGACIGWGFVFADKSSDVRRGSQAARGVLCDTGLQAVEQCADTVTALHCDTYFRDGDETVIFQFEWGDREAVWQAVCTAPGWQTASIPAEAYTALARAEFWTPNEVVAPAGKIVFDAWFYRDDYLVQYGEQAEWAGTYSGLPEVFGLNGLPDTLNATFAFFDRETGAFFYYSYDT